MGKAERVESQELSSDAQHLLARAARFRREHGDRDLLSHRRQVALDKLAIIQAELAEIDEIAERGPQMAEALEQRVAEMQRRAALLRHADEIEELQRLAARVAK